MCCGPRTTILFGPQREQPLNARLVIHQQTSARAPRKETLSVQPRSGICALLHPTALATDNGRAPFYQRAPRGGCCLGGGGAIPLSTEFWDRNHSAFVVGHAAQECRCRVPGPISYCSGLTPTLREDWSCKRALETLCHACVATSPQDPTAMTPDLWSKLTWFTSSVGATTLWIQ